jgi:4-amino-4-deoxy-L-arabinose transferase-like glycosyltransferase
MGHQRVSRPIVVLCLLVAWEALFSVPRLSWELAIGQSGGPAAVGILFGFAAAAGAAALLWVKRERFRGLLAALAGRLERFPRGIWIGCMLLLGIALRLLWVRVFTTPQASDGLAYTQLAMRLARGGAYQAASGTWAEWPPGYPLLLAATFLISGINIGSIVLLNLALFAGTLMSVDALARRLAGDGPARIATLLLAVWPNLVATAGLAAKELLVLFLVTTALTLWLDAGATTSPGVGAGSWLAAGFALGLASLTQPAMLLLPGVLVLYDLLTGPRLLLPRARTLGAWVLLALGIALPIAPWVARNYRIFHRPVLISTNGGSVFYRANNPLATGGWTKRGEKDLQPMSEIEASATGYRWGREWIRDNPGRFLVLSGRKQVLFLGDDAVGLYETLKRGLGIEKEPYPLFKLLTNAWWWCLWLPILLALYTWRSPEPPPAGALLLLLAVLYFWLIDSIFESGARHHVPLSGVLAVLAVIGARGADGSTALEAAASTLVPPGAVPPAPQPLPAEGCGGCRGGPRSATRP